MCFSELNLGAPRNSRLPIFSAEGAFNLFGARGSVSASAQNAIENIVKNSKVSFDYVYVGVPNFDTAKLSMDAAKASEGQNEIMQLKQLTDMFVSNASGHGWKSL